MKRDQMVTTLAVIGGLVILAALAGGSWYVWRCFKGVMRLP